MKALKFTAILAIIFLTASCDKIQSIFNDDDDENEQEISIKELPAAVIDGINELYPGSELLEADEITQDDGSLTYDIEIKFEGDVFEVMYDSDGNFLGVEDDDDDEEDDED